LGVVLYVETHFSPYVPIFRPSRSLASLHLVHGSGPPRHLDGIHTSRYKRPFTAQGIHSQTTQEVGEIQGRIVPVNDQGHHGVKNYLYHQQHLEDNDAHEIQKTKKGMEERSTPAIIHNKKYNQGSSMHNQSITSCQKFPSSKIDEEAV
jgi:hypothetical protein